jgi:glutamate--cysteine ligase
MSVENATPIRDFAELVAHFRAGGKPESAHRLGLEHEKIAVLANGDAPDHHVIARIIETFVKRGWAPIEEEGALIGATHPDFGSLTLEPGGQIEHSGTPQASVAAAVADNDRHLDELVPTCAAEGVRLVATGFRPLQVPNQIPWMPKGRYVVMRDYLPRYGARAHDMMKRTATVQANVDYTDEADAIEKLRLGQGISPLVVALFAASPLANGNDTGEQSYRASAWLETDPARCGLLRFVFEPGASFQGYADWAADVPMFFIYRDGHYHSLAGQSFTFRRFLTDGWRDERATAADWELHLSTLFPEVRLKRYLEVRQADASTREMVRALPALWRGVFANADSRRAAWALVSGMSWDERLRAQQEVPRLGLRASLAGASLHPKARELVSIAVSGLDSVEPAARPLLAPLEEIVATGRTVADAIRERFVAAGDDAYKILDAITI